MSTNQGNHIIHKNVKKIMQHVSKIENSLHVIFKTHCMVILKTDCMIHVKKFTNHTIYIHSLQKHMELGETDYKFSFTSS